MIRRAVLIMTFLVAVLLMALPVMAQAIPTPIPSPQQQGGAIAPPLPVIPLDQAGDLVIAAIIAILVGVVDSPLTTLGVGLLKRVPFLSGVAAQTLQFVVAGVITVAYWASSALGYGAEFNTVAAFLLSIAPAVMGLLVRQAASAGVYKLAVKADLGVLGYQRVPRNKGVDPLVSRYDYDGGLQG